MSKTIIHMCITCVLLFVCDNTHVAPGHFPQKSPTLSGSFVERDLQVIASYASLPPWCDMCMTLLLCNNTHDVLLFSSQCRYPNAESYTQCRIIYMMQYSNFPSMYQFL